MEIRIGAAPEKKSNSKNKRGHLGPQPVKVPQVQKGFRGSLE